MILPIEVLVVLQRRMPRTDMLAAECELICIHAL